MDKTEEKIFATIEKKLNTKEKAVVEFVKELIRIPSVTGKEGNEIQKKIAKKLSTLGFEIDMWEPDIDELKKHPGFVPVENESYKDRPNVVGVYKGEGGGFSLILNGHIDVVPVEDSSKWSCDPWGGETKNGKIFGRGALDMKAGLGAIIMAAETVIQTGIKLKGDLIIEAVVGEESGGNGTLACAIKGYKADAGIIAEPTHFSIAVSNRGAQFFRIRVFGEEGGIEERWGIVNAIDKAMFLYNAINYFAKVREAEVKALPSYWLYDYENLSIKDEKIKKVFKECTSRRWGTKVPTGICKINAGVWPSSISGECIMEGSLECLPGEDINEVKKKFSEYIYEISKLDSWLRSNPPVVEWFGLCFEASQTDINHPIVLSLAKNCKKELNITPPLIGGGGNDLRCLTKYSSTPSVLFGPTGENFHGTDEYCDLKSLVAYTKVIALTIVQWCGMSTK